MQKYAGFALILVLSGLIWSYWDRARAYEADMLPINYVRTEGVFQYLSKDEVKKTLLPIVTTGFFSADIHAIKQAMLKLPWVNQVSVKRVWPDAIAIKVYEQNAYVCWGGSGLLNKQGDLFEPRNVKDFGHLPQLTGPLGQEKKTLEIMKGLSTALVDQALELKEFTISERRAWKIVLANGVEILLGTKNQLKNFQRFLDTLVLFEQEQRDAIATVDLRYPNGYAISWKPDSAAIDWKKIVKERQQS